jgi:hypothetical protein
MTSTGFYKQVCRFLSVSNEAPVRAKAIKLRCNQNCGSPERAQNLSVGRQPCIDMKNADVNVPYRFPDAGVQFLSGNSGCHSKSYSR